MTVIGIVLWALVGALVGAALRPLTHRLIAATSGDRSSAPSLVLEIATAGLFAALLWRFDYQSEVLAYSWLAAISVPLAAIDLTTQRLPTRLILPSYPALIVLFALSAGIARDVTPLFRALAGMAVLLAFYFALYCIPGKQLGAGDVRLAGLLGLALGWSGWNALLLGTFLGWLLAALMRLILRAIGRVASDTPLPLGPFLTVGAFAVVFISQ